MHYTAITHTERCTFIHEAITYVMMHGHAFRETLAFGHILAACIAKDRAVVTVMRYFFLL